MRNVGEEVWIGITPGIDDIDHGIAVLRAKITWVASDGSFCAVTYHFYQYVIVPKSYIPSEQIHDTFDEALKAALERVKHG